MTQSKKVTEKYNVKSLKTLKCHTRKYLLNVKVNNKWETVEEKRQTYRKIKEIEQT